MARKIKTVTAVLTEAQQLYGVRQRTWTENGFHFVQCACCDNAMSNHDDPMYSPAQCGDCGKYVCEECRNDDVICKTCHGKRAGEFRSVWG
jgi:hypothetical protein